MKDKKNTHQLENLLVDYYLNLVLQGLNIVDYLIQHESLSGYLLGRSTKTVKSNAYTEWKPMHHHMGSPVTYLLTSRNKAL